MKVPNSKRVARLVVGLRNSDDYRSGWEQIFRKPWYKKVYEWFTRRFA